QAEDGIRAPLVTGVQTCALPIFGCGVQIITPNAGFRSPDTYVTHRALQAFADGDVHQDNARYRRPLEKDARALLREIGPDCDVRSEERRVGKECRARGWS